MAQSSAGIVNKANLIGSGAAQVFQTSAADIKNIYAKKEAQASNLVQMGIKKKEQDLALLNQILDFNDYTLFSQKNDKYITPKIQEIKDKFIEQYLKTKQLTPDTYRQFTTSINKLSRDVATWDSLYKNMYIPFKNKLSNQDPKRNDTKTMLLTSAWLDSEKFLKTYDKNDSYQSKIAEMLREDLTAYKGNEIEFMQNEAPKYLREVPKPMDVYNTMLLELSKLKVYPSKTTNKETGEIIETVDNTDAVNSVKHSMLTNRIDDVTDEYNNLPQEIKDKYKTPEEYVESFAEVLTGKGRKQSYKNTNDKTYIYKAGQGYTNKKFTFSDPSLQGATSIMSLSGDAPTIAINGFTSARPFTIKRYYSSLNQATQGLVQSSSGINMRPYAMQKNVAKNKWFLVGYRLKLDNNGVYTEKLDETIYAPLEDVDEQLITAAGMPMEYLEELIVKGNALEGTTKKSYGNLKMKK